MIELTKENLIELETKHNIKQAEDLYNYGDINVFSNEKEFIDWYFDLESLDNVKEVIHEAIVSGKQLTLEDLNSKKLNDGKIVFTY